MGEHQVVTEKVVAWAATLFCVFFSAKCAGTFLTHNARLFTAMALFSLTWALLLPFYSTSPNSDLFAAFGGFLLVFVGGLIHKEGVVPHNGECESGADPFHRLALWLLLVLAVPSTISLATPGGSEIGPSQSDIETVVATLMSLLGYVSIALATFKILPKTQAIAIATIASAYSIAEIAYTVNSLTVDIQPSDTTKYWTTKPSPPLTTEWLLGFATLKIVYTTSVAWCITLAGMTSEDKALSAPEKLLLLIGAGRR